MGCEDVRSISEVEFPDPSIINENTKFAVCQNRPYVYIASGNVLYVYNHKDNTVKPLRSDFGRTIRDIAVCPTNYERLGIALENTDDTSKSDFYGTGCFGRWGWKNSGRNGIYRKVRSCGGFNL